MTGNDERVTLLLALLMRERAWTDELTAVMAEHRGKMNTAKAALVLQQEKTATTRRKGANARWWHVEARTALQQHYRNTPLKAQVTELTIAPFRHGQVAVSAKGDRVRFDHDDGRHLDIHWERLYRGRKGT